MSTINFLFVWLKQFKLILNICKLPRQRVLNVLKTGLYVLFLCSQLSVILTKELFVKSEETIDLKLKQILNPSLVLRYLD